MGQSFQSVFADPAIFPEAPDRTVKFRGDRVNGG